MSKTPEKAVACSQCRETGDLRSFGEGGEILCKHCLGDGIRVCSMCGNTEDQEGIYGVGDVSVCAMCHSVEADKYLEWEDGKGVKS